MKSCPECGATYEDGVEFCFVDGHELTEGAESASAPWIAAPALATPAPAGRVGASEPVPVVAPPPAPAPASGSGRGAVALGIGVVVLLLLGVGVVGLVALFALGTEPPPPAPAPAPAPAVAPAPAPLPPPPPVPTPAPVVRMIDVTSDPDGAEVWEGNTLLGVTPCKVEHPDHAPIPRTFTVKLSGYVESSLEMSDPKVPLRATLERAAVVPRNRPAPASPKPGEDILIER